MVVVPKATLKIQGGTFKSYYHLVYVVDEPKARNQKVRLRYLPPVWPLAITYPCSAFLSKQWGLSSHLMVHLVSLIRLPWWFNGKELACQCQETWIWSLYQEDPLEKEMATHPSILVWEIPWAERNLEGNSSWGRNRVRFWLNNNSISNQNNLISKQVNYRGSIYFAEKQTTNNGVFYSWRIFWKRKLLWKTLMGINFLHPFGNLTLLRAYWAIY